jgi:hypothetical protein
LDVSGLPHGSPIRPVLQLQAPTELRIVKFILAAEDRVSMSAAGVAFSAMHDALVSPFDQREQPSTLLPAEA